MVRLRVTDEARRHALLLQGHVHLLRLFDRHPVVRLPVNEEGGRSRSLGVHDRRRAQQVRQPPLLPRRSEELALLGAGDVGDAVVAHPVGDRRACRSRGEAIGLRDDPVGEEAAVRIPRHAQPVDVDRVAFDGVVDPCHDVFVILEPPAAPRRPAERLAVAGGGAGVDVEHHVAVGGQQLPVEGEVVAVGAVRAAVDLEDHGEAAGRCVAGAGVPWCREHPAFDLGAVGAGEQQAFRRRQLQFGEQLPVRVADDRFLERRRRCADRSQRR